MSSATSAFRQPRNSVARPLDPSSPRRSTLAQEAKRLGVSVTVLRHSNPSVANLKPEDLVPTGVTLQGPARMKPSTPPDVGGTGPPSSPLAQGSQSATQLDASFNSTATTNRSVNAEADTPTRSDSVLTSTQRGVEVPRGVIGLAGGESEPVLGSSADSAASVARGDEQQQLANSSSPLVLSSSQRRVGSGRSMDAPIAPLASTASSPRMSLAKPPRSLPRAVAAAVALHAKVSSPPSEASGQPDDVPSSPDLRHAASASSPGHAASASSPGHAASASSPGHAASASSPGHAASASSPGHAASASSPDHAASASSSVEQRGSAATVAEPLEAAPGEPTNVSRTASTVEPRDEGGALLPSRSLAALTAPTPSHTLQAIADEHEFFVEEVRASNPNLPPDWPVDKPFPAGTRMKLPKRTRAKPSVLRQQLSDEEATRRSQWSAEYAQAVASLIQWCNSDLDAVGFETSSRLTREARERSDSERRAADLKLEEERLRFMALCGADLEGAPPANSDVDAAMDDLLRDFGRTLDREASAGHDAARLFARLSSSTTASQPPPRGNSDDPRDPPFLEWGVASSESSRSAPTPTTAAAATSGPYLRNLMASIAVSVEEAMACERRAFFLENTRLIRALAIRQAQIKRDTASLDVTRAAAATAEAELLSREATIHFRESVVAICEGEMAARRQTFQDQEGDWATVMGWAVSRLLQLSAAPHLLSWAHQLRMVRAVPTPPPRDTDELAEAARDSGAPPPCEKNGAVTTEHHPRRDVASGSCAGLLVPLPPRRAAQLPAASRKAGATGHSSPSAASAGGSLPQDDYDLEISGRRATHVAPPISIALSAHVDSRGGGGDGGTAAATVVGKLLKRGFALFNWPLSCRNGGGSCSVRFSHECTEAAMTDTVSGLLHALRLANVPSPAGGGGGGASRRRLKVLPTEDHHTAAASQRGTAAQLGIRHSLSLYQCFATGERTSSSRRSLVAGERSAAVLEVPGSRAIASPRPAAAISAAVARVNIPLLTGVFQVDVDLAARCLTLRDGDGDIVARDSHWSLIDERPEGASQVEPLLADLRLGIMLSVPGSFIEVL